MIEQCQKCNGAGGPCPVCNGSGMATQVVNIKEQRHDQYIGRGTKWGNPFAICKSVPREKSIELYRERLAGKPELMACLGELRGKRLGCFCKPLPCHGDVLVELIEKEDAARK